VYLREENLTIKYKTETYVKPPPRGYLCQGFSHMAKSCRSSTRCGRCTGEHNTRNCGSHTIKCINCGEGHSAAYTGCVAYFRATAITAVARARKEGWTKAQLILKKEKAMIKEEEDRGLHPRNSPSVTPSCSPINGEQGSLLDKSVEDARTPNRNSNQQPEI
jgi:hypothetical protein